MSKQAVPKAEGQGFGAAVRFSWRQVEQIFAGGMPALWSKMLLFPHWLSARPYFLRIACSGYKLGVVLRPSWIGARIRLAKALSRLKRLDEAAACWQKVISRKPNWAEAYERLGDVLLGLDHFEEGISCWRQAAALRPDDMYPEIYRRSVALLHRGQFDATIEMLKMGVETQEEYVRAHQLDRLGIRFLREWTFAIGHMALLDTYVKMGILQLRPSHRSIVLDERPANRCYLEYWRRYLPDLVIDPDGVEILTPLAARLEDHLYVTTAGDDQKMYHLAAAVMVQEQWEREGRSPLLTLTNSDHERGWECLQSLGVPSDAWFVGLHVRNTGGGGGRDSDIGAYRLALESIVSRGGWVIRMGDPSMPPLSPMPQVIDYAHGGARTDWMDVFLWAQCRFFIGTRSGPAYVPPTFGVPCVLTDLFPIVTPSLYPHDIGIYKLYWSEAGQRLLKFSEAFTSRVGLAEFPNYLASVGIRLIDNTAEEINDVVLEMMQILEGKGEYNSEDKQLQARFKMLKPNFSNQIGITAGRVGRDFLRKYSHLL